MREGWKEVRLGDVIFTNKSNINKTYKFEKILYIDISSVGSGEISFNDEILLKDAPSRAKRLVFNGDTILSSVRPANRNFAYFKEVPQNLVVSTGFTTLHPNESKINSRYLYYLISNESFTDYLVSVEKGANYPAVTAKDVEDYIFNLPPLETQKKIAAILSGYDDLIENNLKRIKILEEMAQQTYEEWFVRMRFPKYESATINKETGLPEGWEKVKLKDCCDLVMGQSPKSEFYNEEKLGLPFHQGVKDYGFRFPINTSWSIAGTKKAKPNSILFSVRAPVGRLNVAAEEIVIGRGLAAINHKKNLNSFVFYQLRKIFFEDNLIGGGAIFASVTKTDVERIELINNNELAIMFNELASKIDQQILNLTNQNQRLREARDILLPRLMMGMI
ncbi:MULTISPECIES: restriction endonuclease subunit S [Myroides]|uniref:Type I restriction modification DNA specificity domain-containing protein n=1 Tax=Myroides odoratimimus TaxID=76832 RepID=A0AAI8C5Y2_9FLAO|nr:restriction endonuclease subunit S [Myroides odoratimimus]ALU26634.1 hypothetical protein AS202_10960 [Myroides odoratimimus]MDM1039723.1 restriction endonuclease subunit S [Myroides odoratimimus]MDM1053970.1 restriction endonuclease subunit S [Myroides odoratimimus]MDM1085273.1 restriction endonuclease subunit S [Myroides odoratimimus]